MFFQRERLEARAEALKAEVASEHSESRPSKSARAYAKTYKPGPPVVPFLITLHYINEIVIRKRGAFVELMCRYWSLEREARRGAPLLRWLNPKPWTSSAGGRIRTDEEIIAKLGVCAAFRNRGFSVSCIWRS